MRSRIASSATSEPTLRRSAPGVLGSKSRPVTPGLTMSSGPPAAGATTGSPLAIASCSV